MDEEIHTTDTHSVESSHEPPLSQTDENNQQNQIIDTNNTNQQSASTTIGDNEAVNVDKDEAPVYEEINNNEIQLCFACQKERATVVCSHCCNASSLNSSNANNTNSLLDKIPTINYSRNEDDEATNESQSPIELVKSGNLVYCQECHQVTHLMNENDSPIVCTHCSHKNANPVDRIAATNHEHKSERSIARELVKNGNLVYCEECFEIIHLVKKNHIPIPLLTTTQAVPTSSKPSEINNNQEEFKPAEEQTQSNTDQVTLNPAETEPQATIQPSETIELVQVDENEEKQNINHSFAVINDLSKDVGNLMKRCEQLNDVKQSIRQMNDQIKDDLYIDFASVAAKLKAKLDEMTDKIKEKLKDAYTVVRDAQTKLSTKLHELRDSLRELELKPNDEHLLNKIKHITEQINFIQDELKMICEPNSCSMAMGNHFNTATASYTSIASTYSCSLFLDNYLYPQFNYYVDLTQLVESIRKLDVNINILPTLSSPVDINRNLLLTNNIDLEFSDLNQLADNMCVDCLVSSGINNDGSFWLQPVLNSNLHTYTSLDDLQKFKKLAQKVNLFLEELSKFVRRKRIGDREWQTFAEASLSPQQNDKCFCLETKTRRWMRSQIVAFEPSSKTCQVRHLDTGLIDTNSYTLDNLIPWKDFGLANLPYRALRCVLYKHNNNENENGARYENDIQLETRFLFKDLTTNQALKCSLVERIKLDEHDDVWIIKLIRNGDFRHVEKSLVESENVFAEIHNNPHTAKFLINEKVIKSNEQEKQLKVNPTLANRKFGCNDIRVEAGQMEMSQRSVITGSQSQETTQPIAVAQSDAQSLEPIKEDNTHPAQATVDAESKQSDEEKKVPIEVVSSQTSLASTQPELEEKTQPVEADLVVKDEVILPSQTTLDRQSIDDLSQKEKTEEMTTNASSVSLNQQLDDHLQHDPADILDIIDQTDERRLHRSREGTCRVMTHLGRHGNFWIKPHLDIQMSRELDDLREFIGEFIRKTQYKSYGELKLVPEIWRKCFIRHTKSTQPKKVQNTSKSSYHQNAECHIEWDRGFIEEVNRSKEVCFVRLMDAGRQVEVPFQDIYPHRRLDLNQFAKQHNYPMTQSSFKLNYAAIRCCLFSTYDQAPQIEREETAHKFFRQVTLGSSMNFKLVKQVYSKNTRINYWMTTLQTHEYDDVALALMFKCNLKDQRLLSTTIDTKIVQSKSADICKMSTANSETMMAELTHSSLKAIAADDSISNRNWIHVEARQVRPAEKRKKKKKRSRSLNRSDREKRNEVSASSSMRRSKSIVAPRRTVGDSPAESTRIVSSRSQTSAINQGMVSRIAKILNLPRENSSTTEATPAKPAVSNSKSTTNVTESQPSMTQSLLSTTQPLARSGSDLLHSELLLHQHQNQSMIHQLHTLPPPNAHIIRQASWESGIHNPKQQQLHSRHNMDSNRHGTRQGNALLPRSELRNDYSNNNNNSNNNNRFSEFTSRNRKQYELRQGMGEPPSDLMEHDPTSNPKSLPSSSKRRDPKPRNNNRFDNCKQDFHNYHRRDHHRDDDNYGSGGGGGGGGGNRFYQQSQYNSQGGGGGGGNGHSSAGGSGNRNSYGNKRQQLSYDEMGPCQMMIKNNTYLVAYQGVDDDNDQSSSIFNDVFIEDDDYVELDEHAEKLNYQSPAFYGHLAMRGHFLDEDAQKVAVNHVQCRQVDLMELEDYADLFDMPNGSHNSRLANANYLNSSPNSPYQKLFKLHVPNSYEPVLNRISENDSIRTNNNNNCTHADVHSHVNEPETVTSASSSLNYHMLMNDEIERKRGVEPNSEKTSDGDVKNGKGFKSTNAAPTAESSDEVLANLIVDESSNSLDLTMYDDMLGLDDGEPGVELDADAAAATTLDITQPVADRHAMLFPHFISTLNDRASNNNKSISSTTTNNGRQFGAAMMRVRAIDFNHRILKHRSFSADIALMDAKKPTNDEHKKLIISPSTSSSSSSSSTSSSSPSTPSSITLLKKQMQLEKTSPVRLNSNNNNNNKSEDEENESYASCAEEIKSNSSHSLAAAPTTEHKLKSYDNIIFKSNPNMNFNFAKYDSIKIEEPKYITKNNNVNLDPASDSKQNSTTSSSTLTARLIESSRRFSSTPNLAEFVCASTAHHGAADTTTADLVDSSACCKNNNDNNALCLSKKERIKNFTVAIFVDSFEDYSLNKTPPSGESSTLSSSTIQLRSPAKETDSLREFEQTERKLKAREPELTDDPFIFDSNPNNYSLIEKHILNAADGQQILASKPPILPTPNNHSHHSNNNNNNSSNNSNSNNAALVQSNTHNCLSTITEYSNETYETTCSSNNNGNNNDDNDATTTANRNVDFKRKLDYFNNRAQSGSSENLSKFVTVRRADLKKSRSSDDQAQPDGCFEPQAGETATAAANRVRTSASLNELSRRLNELLRQQQRLSNDANETINRTSPSILVTDLLFEKFCLLSNDEILVPTSASSSSTMSQSFSLEQNMTNTSVVPDQTTQVKFVPNNSNCFKINSKLLMDLLNAQDHEQLSSILSMDSKLLTNATANNDEDKEAGNIGESMDANSQFTSSSLLAESNLLDENAATRQPVTTTTMAPLNDTANQSLRNNNNRSALENSSCTSDSLFNSNLIITPMYSEAVSPTQLGSLLLPLKSPLPQPNTPPNQRAHATADSTLKSLSSSFRSPTSGVPPAPPFPDFFLHRANVSPPLPPPPAEYSPLPNELDDNLPLPPPPVIPTAPPMPASNIFKSTKAPAPQPPTGVKKNKQKPAVSSLIESLTARLNLIQLNKSLMHNNNNRPPLNVTAKSNTEPNSPKITSGSSQPTSIFRNSPIKINSASMQNLKSSPKFNSPSHTDNFLHNWQKPDYLNRVQSTKSSSMRLTNDTTDRVDKKLTTASSWTGANFSLYGLDTDETVDQQQQQQTLYVKNQAYNHSVRVRNLSDSRVPWPPTPVSPNGGVDFYANLVPSESEQSLSLPPPPSQFQTSPRDQSPVKSIPLPPPISPLLQTQPQPTPAVPRPMPASSTHSSSSSVTTVINAQNPTRLSSFLKSIEQDSKTWTSLNPANINAADMGTGDKSAPPDPSSDSSVPNATKPFNSCPNLADQLAPSFKLDHLADINPKRLYKNSKFRCRIHDVIDERGQFWLEVIYSKEDERKFAEMYRLLRLGSRMSQPPGDVPVGRRLSALYKGDWHRAVVIDNNDKVKVKFLDLGIVKVLDRSSELRVVDEKFFNFPLKALKCSIYLDEDIDQLVVGKKLISNQKLSLSKEARKFFIRLIYKKVLFAKVVDFKHEYNADNEKSSVCRIKLGYQVQRGIIDVYMYILSKYDRKRYELMKMIAASASTSTSSSCVPPVVVSAPPLPQQVINDSVESSSCTTPTPVESNTNELNHKAMLASPTSSTDEKITEIDKKVEQLYENMIGQANVDYVNAQGEYDEEETRYNEDEIYDFRYINNRIIEREIEVIGQRSQTDDEDQYQDQETLRYFENDDMLFSEIGSLLYRIRESELNEEDDDDARPLHGHSHDESSSSFVVDGEKKMAPQAEDDDDNDDDNDYGLDFTPVKGDNQLRVYNYDGLRIEPINLPSLDGTDAVVNDHIKSRDQAPLYARRPEDDASTVKVNTHSRLRVNKYYRAEDLIRTPIAIPMANPVKSSSNRYSSNLMANYNSDTDSSIHAPCCKIPSLKIRKNSNKKENNQLQNHRNLEHQRKIVEEFTTLIATKNGVSKKVKFQVK